MARDFFNYLSPAHRALLEQIGETLDLAPRYRLMRRGEPGGDVFRVEKGQLDVIDTRSRPEVILDKVGPGELLGEMSFLDGSPRSADVVAGVGCQVTRWPRESLEELLNNDPTFAARFWWTMARSLSERLREVNANVAQDAWGSGSPETATSATEGPVLIAREHARAARDGLADLDRTLRRDENDAEALHQVTVVLDHLQGGLHRLQTECGNRADMAGASRLISREVQPYLIQATTANLSLAQRDSHVAEPRVLAHILEGEPSGDGTLGRAVDRWLLDRPFSRALRERDRGLREILANPIRNLAEPVRVMVINNGPGRVAESVFRALSPRRGTLLVVEPHRDTLRHLAASFSRRTARLNVQYVHDSLADLAQGRALQHFEGQQYIILDGLVEYLPARVATRCLQHLGALLASGGSLATTAVQPGADSPFWEYLLSWPSIRRAPGVLKAILTAAGYRSVTFPPTPGDGMLVLAGSPTPPDHHFRRVTGNTIPPPA